MTLNEPQGVDADKLISDQLVVFRTVDELQAKNQTLLKVLP